MVPKEIPWGVPWAGEPSRNCRCVAFQDGASAAADAESIVVVVAAVAEVPAAVVAAAAYFVAPFLVALLVVVARQHPFQRPAFPSHYAAEFHAFLFGFLVEITECKQLFHYFIYLMKKRICLFYFLMASAINLERILTVLYIFSICNRLLVELDIYIKKIFYWFNTLWRLLYRLVFSR